MLKIYDFLSSGNGYKVRLLQSHPAIPYEHVEMDISKEEAHTPLFLSQNPNGRITVLEIEPDSHLAESNAILQYLAKGSELLPEDPLQ